MKKNGKMMGMILASAIMTAAAAGTGFAEETLDATVRYGISIDPGSLTPWASSIGSYYTYPGLYETLFWVDKEDGEMKPYVAQSMEESDDHLTYTVTLFDNVYDSEGNHLTAEDVKFSYDMCSASKNWPNCTYIDAVNVIDDYTVEFQMNYVGIGTMEQLLTETFLVTQAAYEASSDAMATTPVGTGPYVLDEYVAGSKIAYTAREDYWQTDANMLSDMSKANIKNVVYNIIPDATQVANGLVSGDIDLAASISTADLNKFLNDDDTTKDGYYVQAQLSNLLYIMMFNCSDGSDLASKELRQAIAYAVDKQSLVDGAMDGRGEALSTFGNRLYKNYQEKWDEEDYYNYDPEKAAQLVKESGFNTSKTLRLLTMNDPVFSTAAQIIQAELSIIGVNVEIMSYDQVMFISMLSDSTQWDIALQIVGASLDSIALYDYTWNTTTHDYGNMMFVKDEEFQKLFETCMSLDGNTAENIDAVHQYAKESAYAIGLVSPYSYAASVDEISDIYVPYRPFIIPGPCTYSESFGQ